MDPRSEELPTDPVRLKAFARFFKGYMGVSSFVVAALPIPVTAFGALPTFADHKGILSTYTSMFCFLVLGFIFYVRHELARWMFSEQLRWSVGAETDSRVPWWSRSLRAAKPWLVAAAPLVLILMTLNLAFLYHADLDRAVIKLVPLLCKEGKCPDRETILKQSHLAIPEGSLLMFRYVVMFVCAESAFILMAIREYLQDLLKVSELQAITGHREPEPGYAASKDGETAERAPATVHAE